MMKEKANLPLLLLRGFLLLLILANMTLIFLLSHQNGKKSGDTSKQVTTTVAQVTVKDFEEKEEPEKAKIVAQLDIPVRTLAHMAEFGSLGALTLALLLTWKKMCLIKYSASIAFAFLYACTDEWHQKTVGGRYAHWQDVALDTLGAAICCTLILLLYLLILKKARRKKELP